MKSWLKKKLGVTPEIAQKVQAMELSASARAAASPFVVNRQVIVLLPLEKYFVWTNQWLSHRKDSPAPLDHVLDRWACSRAFLISRHMEQEELTEFLKNQRKYFMEFYLNGHKPKSLWPWKPSEEEFSEWFEILRIDGGLWDMETNELQKEPDIGLAIMHEL